MNSLKNSVQLLGHIGKDLELINLEKGGKLAKFSLATTEYYKNSNGEKQENTQWHRIIAWGNLAEQMSKFLSKGNEVLIQGKISYGNYEDKDGVTRYTTDIIAREFIKITKEEK